jgi:hypothetical protein
VLGFSIGVCRGCDAAAICEVLHVRVDAGVHSEAVNDPPDVGFVRRMVYSFALYSDVCMLCGGVAIWGC